MEVRKYINSDSIALAKLFYETIHTVNRFDYNQEQLNAWAPVKRDMHDWEKSFENKWVFVAQDELIVTGFGELEPDGHIDRFYTSKDYIAQGVGRKIFNQIESTAITHGISLLFVEASITARLFFEKMGFILIKEQVVRSRCVDFINYLMEKRLDS